MITNKEFKTLEMFSVLGDTIFLNPCIGRATLPQKTLGRDSIGHLQFLGVADGTR